MCWVRLRHAWARVVLALLIVTFAGRAAEIPRKAPELIIRLPGGKQIKLSDFRGKVVALEFLLTTCPHCKRTSSTMERVYRDLGPKGFQPLGAAFNDGAESLVAGYVQELGLTYPVGYTDRDTVIAFLQHPVMLTLWTPQLVLIDKKGMIRAQYPGTHQFFRNEEENLRYMVERLLKE